jgi:ankyrin repeat protein
LIIDENPEQVNGLTPLHLAAQNGNREICELILDSIQYKMPKDQNGKTPVILALENQHFGLSLRLINSQLQI